MSHKSATLAAIDAIAFCDLMDVETPVKTCPYCGADFRPRFYPPTEDQVHGRWQKHCSRLCARLAREDAQ